jgi:hypothetical protein
MAIEISGKIVKILPLQSGTGRNGTWSKQEFIIETNEQYPKKICISAWGDKTNALAQIATNASVKVSINIESREFNDKWYTDLRAWKIEPLQNEYSDKSYGEDFPVSDTTARDNALEGTFYDESNDLEPLPF